MKTLIKNNLLLILTLLLLSSLASCSKKINFLTSSVVPAARGYVKINNDRNKNYAIQIQLLELAEVQRLQPPKQTYVIWMVTEQDISKNIGQLKSSSGMLSKQLKASFKTVSSFKPSQFFITAEDDSNVQFPGTQVVISTEKF